MQHYYHSVRLDMDKCKGCTTCLKRCPTEAIRIRNNRASILNERCIDCGECIKVCANHAKVAVTEIPDVDPARAGGVEAAREREGAGILAAVPECAHVILMAIEGKQRSSVDFSRHLDDLALRGASELAFVIGGSDGVSDAVRARADETFSFGPITLPHNLARVVLLEQLYRAFKLSRGEPYHK